MTTTDENCLAEPSSSAQFAKSDDANGGRDVVVASAPTGTSEAETFSVVFKGLRADFPAELAQENIARLFGATREQIHQLCAGGRTTVKNSVPLDVAQKYIEAIEKAGGACELIRNSQQIIPAPSLGNNEAPVAAVAAEQPTRQPPAYASSFQSASDTITEKLGLERIEGFSVTALFSEVFRKHDPEEIENLLSVGTSGTTPAVNSAMGVMPNPWIFFRVLVATIAAYLVFYYAWDRFENINVVPGLIIIGSFAVPFSVLILFFELNTPRNVSLIKVVQLVIVGGAISILLSLFLFELTPFLGVFGASAAGIVEEVGKLAALLFILRKAQPERYKYRLNALLLGAAVGAGFAAFESAGYALRIGLMDNDGMLANIQLRGAMSPFAHIVWTAIAASAFWAARSQHNSTWDTLQSATFLKIFAIPVCLHFVWNTPFEGPFMIKYIVLGFIAWVVVISLVQSGLREMAEASSAQDRN